MANRVYNHAGYLIAKQQLDLESVTLKMLLINNSYTFDQDHIYIDEGGTHDVKDAEITAVTNYARKELTTGKAWAKNDASDLAWFDADDPTVWNNLGGASNDTIEAVVLVYDTGDDATSILIAYFDTVTGTPVLPFLTTGGNFTVNINATGLIHLKMVP